jgi:peptidoglycan/LPS O-acetylase OafA/YrhL
MSKAPVAAHFQRIDVLRGIAILAVFLHHYWLGVSHESSLQNATEFSARWRPLFALHEFGYFGVKLFFVISGFCIHHSYLNWRARNPASPMGKFLPMFVHRRFWRIVPPYVVVLVPLYFWKYSAPFSLASLKHLAVHLTLTNTLVPGFFYNIDPAFWSIAVEWQLYLIYPLILLLALKSSWRLALGTSLVVAGVFKLALPHLLTTPLVLNLPFTWWYDWVIGAVLAAEFAEKRKLFRAHGWLLLALAVLIGYDLVHWHNAVFALLLPPAFFAVLVEMCLWARRPLTTGERALGVLGLCSFSFYLLHGQITYLFLHYVGAAYPGAGQAQIWLGACGLVFALILAVSWVNYRIFELGSVRVGDALWKTRKGASPQGAAEKQVSAVAP